MCLLGIAPTPAVAQEIPVLFELVPLHTVDGREIDINPAEITQLHESKIDDSPDRLMVKGVRCVVSTTDGKFISVTEDCSEIRTIINGEIRKAQEYRCLDRCDPQ